MYLLFLLVCDEELVYGKVHKKCIIYNTVLIIFTVGMRIQTPFILCHPQS